MKPAPKAISRSTARAIAKAPAARVRRATSSRRLLPSFIIIGAQRAGTTSLYEWICSQPGMTAAFKKEVHYFDLHYDRGEEWYRSHFRLDRTGTKTGEASPYMLFHPLAPERAAHDLSDSTRFIALLREPVDRAVSHYWHERKGGKETESFDRAIALEPKRLAGAEEALRKGEYRYAHQHYSYAARGEYAGQLRRWFDAVGRDRVLVVECEKVFNDASAAGEVLEWMGLPPSTAGFPSLNGAKRKSRSAAETIESLQERFVAHNAELFELLGRELWV